MDDFKTFSRRITERMEDAAESEKDAEKAMQQDQEEARETEREEEGVEEEIEDAEDSGSPSEIKDAEKKQKRIIQHLEDQSQLIDRAIRDVEEAVQDTEQEEELFESAEEEVIAELEDAISRLGNVYKIFAERKEDDQRIYKKNMEVLEAVLNSELLPAAEAYSNFLELQVKFIEPLEEAEKDAFKLENLSQELLDELEMDRNEVKELLLDSEKLQNKQMYQQAEAEGHELGELMKHWKDEESEEEKIEVIIQREADEARNIVELDEDVLRLLNKAVEILESLEEILESEKSFIRLMSSARIQGLIRDVKQARETIEELYREDRDRVEKLRTAQNKLYSGHQS